MPNRNKINLTGSDSQFSAYSFWIEIDGISVGYFSEVQGFPRKSKVQKPTNVHGTGGHQGAVKSHEITLQDGYINIQIFHDWILPSNSEPGVHMRKNMSIIQRENSDSLKAAVEVRRWNCYGCFPKSWKMASLDGKGNDVLTEGVVIVIEYFEEA